MPWLAMQGRRSYLWHSYTRHGHRYTSADGKANFPNYRQPAGCRDWHLRLYGILFRSRHISPGCKVCCLPARCCAPAWGLPSSRRGQQPRAAAVAARLAARPAPAIGRDWAWATVQRPLWGHTEASSRGNYTELFFSSSLLAFYFVKKLILLIIPFLRSRRKTSRSNITNAIHANPGNCSLYSE